ncbi:CDP-glycerol glycerophosphotransferase family protein [Ewingella sp. CoE-038-23]|uniref:CDP-glycerol glycerophosphotransferase family protein n=1 Tax=Ewingella docleensis TaxID=3118588 RepID=UPI0033657423
MQNFISPEQISEAVHSLESLSCQVPKKRRVLFFGRESFSDNSKYLYLYMLENCPHIEVIWCSAERGVIDLLQQNKLPCHYLGEDFTQSADLLLHAAVAVFCVNPSQSLLRNLPLFACLHGAKQIQLWHGISVKRLLMQLIPHLGVADVSLRIPFYCATRANAVLSTSPKLDGFWQQVFGNKQMLRAGFPRNEVLLRKARSHELIGAELKGVLAQAINRKRPKVLIVPTWQRGKATLLSSPEFLIKILNWAVAKDVDLWLKPHPLYVYQNINDQRKIPHLHTLPAGVDIYPHMKRFDLLITDYSSIMFDFMLTGKPVMTLDLQPGEHQNFEPDYSLLPGQHDFSYPFTLETLETTLNTALQKDHKQAARQALLEDIFPTPVHEACATLAAGIEREMASVK